MSEGKRYPYKIARSVYDIISQNLYHVTDRLVMAGSLRREKPDIGDIEIVCIPKPHEDLLGAKIYDPLQIKSRLANCGYELLKNGPHYKQFFAYKDLKCDLFITTPECWGVILAIRTGPAEFSRKLVTAKRDGGYMPSNLKVKDGRVWNGDTVFETPDEMDVFKLFGMPFISPKDR